MILVGAVFTLMNLVLDPPLWWFLFAGWASWLGFAWLMWHQRGRWWLVLLLPVVWSVAISVAALQVCGMTGAAGVLVACQA